MDMEKGKYWEEHYISELEFFSINLVPDTHGFWHSPFLSFPAFPSHWACDDSWDWNSTMIGSALRPLNFFSAYERLVI